MSGEQMYVKTETDVMTTVIIKTAVCLICATVCFGIDTYVYRVGTVRNF